MYKYILGLIVSFCLTISTLNAKEILVGKIVEAINVPGYSYLRIKTKENKNKWVAILEGNYKKNQEIKVIYEFELQNFKSKILNKEFESIAFGVIDEKYQNDFSEKREEIKRTTIHELINKSSAYNNQIIQIEGIITKISRGIMHSNWVHIQDTKGNKLIFRTNENNIQLGDQIIATGQAATNLDYGHGYKYDLLIINTTVEQKFDPHQV